MISSSQRNIIPEIADSQIYLTTDIRVQHQVTLLHTVDLPYPYNQFKM